MKGTVKWYDDVKGFGFIQTDDGQDIFVHRTGIDRNVKLDTGVAVEFEVKQGDKGLIATEVKTI